MTRPELEVGSTGEASWIVEESDLASRLSDGHAGAFPAVFSTARMVALMELAAARVLVPILAPGELSVGTVVNVRHTAATPPAPASARRPGSRGWTGKFYGFEVIAFDPAGEIGRGNHSRAIIDAERLTRGADRRKA